MTIGVYVWFRGEEFAMDFLLLFMFLHITQVFPTILFSNDFTLK